MSEPKPRKAVPVPRAVAAALARTLADELGGPVVLDGIRVIERSRWADFLSALRRFVTGGRSRIRATTRRERIFLASRVSPDAFFADETLLLHEFFHVVAQWNAGRMTHASYLRNPARWEREAVDFADRALARYRAALEEERRRA